MKRSQALFSSTVVLGLSLTTACGLESSKSPEFAPGTIVSVTGQYLKENGEPLRDTPIAFKNLRRFGYIDSLDAAQAEVTRAFSQLFIAAFPLFNYYDPVLGMSSIKEDPSKYTKKPNYYLDQARTDSSGKFSFQINSEKLLRDAEGGINIVIVNEKDEAPEFGKFVFVVKGADTDLGSIRLCTLGGINMTENETDDTVTFSWTKPQESVQQYVMRFGIPEDGSALWTENVAGDLNSATLPRAIFHNRAVRLAIEAFYLSESEKKNSCLTPPKDFQLNSGQNLVSAGVLAESKEIKFKLNSLTNGKFDDHIYLQAFDVNSLTFDLKEKKVISKIGLFNLNLKTKSKIEFLFSNDGETYTEAESADAKRFQLHQLTAPVEARFIQIKTESRIVDLKEIAFFN